MATPQDSMVAGLFTTPDQYQQQRQAVQRAQALEMARLDPFQQGQANIQMGINRIADVGAGALGIQDPQLQALSTIRELSNKYDTNTSGGVAGLATELQQRGLTQQAFQLGQKALSMRKLEAEAQAKTAERLTNEQKNATAIADSAGLQRGTSEWTDKYNTELARLTAGSKGANIKEIGVAAKTREPVYFDVATDSQFTIKQDPTNPGKQIRVPFNGGVDRTTSSTNVGFSPEIKMTNQELDWRKQFLSENKPVIEQAANVQQSLNLLQQSQTSPFADAAFANTVVSAFGGDKQKSKSEIDRLVKAGSLDERVANTVKGFFEGTTSAKTKEDQLKVLTAVDKILEQRYNNSSKAWSTRLTAAKVNPELIVPTYAETVGVGGAPKGANLPPEGTRLRNKATRQIEVVRNGKLVPE
jgi:hypothetical protein